MTPGTSEWWKSAAGLVAALRLDRWVAAQREAQAAADQREDEDE